MRALAPLVAVGAAATLSACGGNDRPEPTTQPAPVAPARVATVVTAEAPAGAKIVPVKVTITPKGCDVSTPDLPAGPVRFDVTNSGRTSLNEFEVQEGSLAIGEIERLSAGDTRSFTLTLHAGAYGTRCVAEDVTGPEFGKLAVTGANGEKTAPEVVTDKAAIAKYRTYVQEQTAILKQSTKTFVDAVVAGDLKLARATYASARIPYERIEPVAEAFGNLDPLIDIRADAVGGKVKFTGFHRLERAIFKHRSLAGMKPIAQQLQANVHELGKLIPTLELAPEQIANGANSLLDEVSKSKITGEEERYSGIDLVDFQANVDGARAAFDSVGQIVGQKSPPLYEQISGEFANVNSALNDYRRGEGFVHYSVLKNTDTRKLSQSIDALAEPLSQVASTVVG